MAEQVKLISCEESWQDVQSHAHQNCVGFFFWQEHSFLYMQVPIEYILITQSSCLVCVKRIFAYLTFHMCWHEPDLQFKWTCRVPTVFLKRMIDRSYLHSDYILQHSSIWLLECLISRQHLETLMCLYHVGSNQADRQDNVHCSCNLRMVSGKADKHLSPSLHTCSEGSACDTGVWNCERECLEQNIIIIHKTSAHMDDTREKTEHIQSQHSLFQSILHLQRYCWLEYILSQNVHSAKH